MPDKINDMIFLKHPMTLFVGHFLTILVINPAVTHNYMWVPNTILSFRKNYWGNSKKTYGQTEGRMEGRMDRPYFIGPFRPRLGV